MQINRWLYLSSSIWGIPLRCDLSKKGIDQNHLFLLQKITELYKLVHGLQNNFLVWISQYSEKVAEKKKIGKCKNVFFKSATKIFREQVM